jgi:hypothetical protein
MGVRGIYGKEGARSRPVFEEAREAGGSSGAVFFLTEKRDGLRDSVLAGESTSLWSISFSFPLPLGAAADGMPLIDVPRMRLGTDSCTAELAGEDELWRNLKLFDLRTVGGGCEFRVSGDGVHLPKGIVLTSEDNGVGAEGMTCGRPRPKDARAKARAEGEPSLEMRGLGVGHAMC